MGITAKFFLAGIYPKGHGDLKTPKCLVLFAIAFSLLVPSARAEQDTSQSNVVCAKLVNSSELFDFHRDWGYQLLSRDDIAWRNEDYLRDLHAFAVPATTNFHGTAVDLLKSYISKFEELASGSILDFSISGTAANNSLLVHSDRALHARAPDRSALKSQVIFLDQPFLGLAGPMHNMKFELAVSPGPTVHPNIPPKGHQLKELIDLENQTLLKIQDLIQAKDSRVGAILFEPISVNNGVVRKYRTQFLIRLQRLARANGVLIFADEVMSGGGRTGKFWAFQHYPGFRPDMVTFGKGLILSGVFIPKGSITPMYSQTHTEYTTASNSLAVLQGLQVLKAIIERNLIENARAQGLELRRALLQNTAATSQDIRCVGLLCSVGESNGYLFNSVVSSRFGRWLPPITITKTHIDELMKRLSPLGR